MSTAWSTGDVRVAPVAVALAAAVVLAVVGCGASPAPSSSTVPPSAAAPSPTPRQTISPDQARAAAEAFLGEPLPGATVTPPDPSAPRALYIVDSPVASIFVDAFDGTVGGYTRMDLQVGAGAPIARERAIDAAASFLSAHHVVPPAFAPSAELIDHGESSEWAVVWQARVGAAIAPDRIRVGIDAASGTVMGMVRTARPYVAPPLAEVGRDAAVDRARTAAGMSDGSVESAELWIAFAPDGTQVLVWRIQLAAPDDGYGAALVEVDAITGRATVTGRG